MTEKEVGSSVAQQASSQAIEKRTAKRKLSFATKLPHKVDSKQLAILATRLEVIPHF